MAISIECGNSAASSIESKDFVNRDCFAVASYENGTLTCGRCGAKVRRVQESLRVVSIGNPKAKSDDACESDVREAARALLRIERVKIVVSN